MKNCLIVFAREPIPGKVKTRLAASIGNVAAADAYAAMLVEVLDTCRKLADLEMVVYWDCDETSLPLLADRYACRSRKQSAGDLGQRMKYAFAEMFETGFDTCCIIGSDAPDLPVSYIQEAVHLLVAGQIDAVFGPTHDGGYYLLGLSRIWPRLFTDIDWSTPQVLQQSLTAGELAGVRATLLPEWYDIDTQQDLEKYRERKRAQTQAQTGAL
jgi:rSAM/selenodomain-associated transferase 1